ncbi:MAG: ABC transporter ATP-binding protein [Anaerolineae bacterium]
MLQVTELSYQYGVNSVLLNVGFELPGGTVAALVGRNGAGKSTLLRCLAGWTAPMSGTIAFNGRRLRQQERDYQRDVVLVPDTPDFYDELTAWDHLQMVGQLHRIGDWKARSASLLEQFQLADARGAFPFTFSRGMRYKLALCMALIVQPPLLLLDEPFGPLDSLANRLLWQHLQAYGASGRTVLFSSHVLPDGERPGLFLVLRDKQITPVDPAGVANLADVLDEE